GRLIRICSCIGVIWGGLRLTCGMRWGGPGVVPAAWVRQRRRAGRGGRRGAWAAGVQAAAETVDGATRMRVADAAPAACSADAAGAVPFDGPLGDDRQYVPTVGWRM